VHLLQEEEILRERNQSTLQKQDQPICQKDAVGGTGSYAGADGISADRKYGMGR
jgi:hypothetical protein